MLKVVQGFPVSVLKEYCKISLEKWSSRISVAEDYSLYKIHIDVHEFEEYVDILPEYLKYSLFDFGTGCQKLAVNCKSKLPRQKRICSACRKRLLGDEFHILFTLHVIVLKNLVIILVIPKYFRTRCSTLKMTQLLNSIDRKF